MRVVMAVAGVAAGLGVAGEATAQDIPVRPLAPGTPVVEQLTAEAPTFEHRGGVHVYRMRVRPDRRYVIRLASSDFDTYLWVARQVGPLTEELASNDDAGGANATDSRLAYRPETEGDLLVVAQAFSDEGVGTYTLTVDEIEPVPPPTPRPLAVGDTVAGQLDERSPVLEDEDDVPYQLYALRLDGEGRVRVVMLSEDFDAYLSVRRDGEEVASDDDGYGGSNARVHLTEPGDYTIVARAYGSNGAGHYILSASLAPMARLARFPITAGEEASRSLTDSDAETDEGQYLHEYVLMAEAGARYRIELRSDAFDAYLRWGRGEGEVFDELARDDDGLSGTNSMLEVVAEAAGEYRIRVHALSGGGVGAYQLRVTKQP